MRSGRNAGAGRIEGRSSRWVAAIALAGWLAGCDEGVEPAAIDGAPEDVLDAAPDAAASDGMPDRAVDGSPVADADPDGAPDLGPAPSPAPCAVVESARADDALRVAGCRFVRGGAAAAVPRVVVVSGDSLARAAATPLHSPPMWAELRDAGVETVWLLALWDGIEPMRGTYNGAYTARLCQSAREAGDAGLEVVLAMTQQRFGPAVGGHGMPAWATPGGLDAVPVGAGPEHPTLAAAWSAFWAGDDAGPDGLLAAWTRLLDTCRAAEANAIAGVVALEAPLGRPEDLPRFVALSDAVEAAAEARFGPLLRFEYGLWSGGDTLWMHRPGPDRARVVPGWGPARWPGAAPPADGWRVEARDAAIGAGRPLWFVGVGGDSVAAMRGALAAVEAVGQVAAVWQDGLGTPYGLRDDEGRPGPLWAPALRRIRPARLAGRPLGWREEGGAWILRWLADGSDQGLSRIDLAGRGPGAVALSPDAFDWFTDHDPATGLLTVYVDGAGVVELRVALDDEE